MRDAKKKARSEKEVLERDLNSIQHKVSCLKVSTFFFSAIIMYKVSVFKILLPVKSSRIRMFKKQKDS